jgi:hypothetical protein
MRLNCWTLSGGLVACVTPLAHLEKLPFPHMISLDSPAFHSRCPKPVQIFGSGTGSRVSYAYTVQTAY